MQKNPARIEELVETIRSSLLMQDTEHPLFHGSWDWHSAVHGHWALLHHAMAHGDEPLLHWLHERFDTDGLSREIEYLFDNPQFERPYGRAWLLAMAIAHIKAGMPGNIRPNIDLLARDLWEDISTRKADSEAGEYESQTWALLQLHMWFSFTASSMAEEVKDWVELNLRNQGCHPSQDNTRSEFFSCWALQALLIAEVLGRAALASWIAEQSHSTSATAVINTPQSIHHLGMNATRAWGFWAVWRTTGDVLWDRAYHAHLQASLDLHDQWKDDHYSYGHWVPQFTLYAYFIEGIHLFQ